MVMKYMALILSFSFTLLSFDLKATQHHIAISGTSYVPSELVVEQGDTITISASSFHPLVQVSKETWEANQPTALSGGWGSKTSDYTFVASDIGQIYFVCSNHVGSGMKGIITVIECCLDVFNISEKDLFWVYPNPVKEGILNIHRSANIKQPLYFTLYSIIGKQVSQVSLNDKTCSVDINLKAGMYIYVIHDRKGLVFKKGRILIE